MKQIFILALVMSWLFSESMESLTINDQKFSLEKGSYNIYDSKGSYVKFYRVESNKTLTPVLRLTLNDTTGSCESKSLENGAYEIDGATITFYTLWERKGRAYFDPFGAKIQKYKVTSDGKLEELSSMLYIEKTKRDYDDESGMRYLFQKAKNEIEKEQFYAYVKEVESEYGGKFVFANESLELINRVEVALKRKLRLMWSQ